MQTRNKILTFMGGVVFWTILYYVSNAILWFFRVGIYGGGYLFIVTPFFLLLCIIGAFYYGRHAPMTALAFVGGIFGICVLSPLIFLAVIAWITATVYF